MTIRVLVVDDDDQIRRSLATSLGRSGFDVCSADDGVSAFALAATHVFDVLIVDFNLKTTTGDEVVRHFRQRFGDSIFCAVLSGEDDDTTRELCRNAGANDVFLKPASPRVLRDRLNAAVAELRSAA